MNETFMTPAAIAATAGAVLSLLFNYIPGLNTRFDRLSADMQRTVMGVFILLTSIGMAFWQCSGDNSQLYSICGDGMNWRAILTNAVFALVGNQSVDRISPKPRTEEVKPAGVIRPSVLSRKNGIYPPPGERADS